MTRKQTNDKPGRRQFLTGVIAAGATTAATVATTVTPSRAADASARAPSALPPSAKGAEAEAGTPRYAARDRKSTRLNSSHVSESRMPSSA